MSRISDALKQIKNMTWVKVPYLPSVERYIETGDEQALAKVSVPAPGQNVWWYWGSTLAEALRTPDAWQDEDRRAVHVLAAAGFGETAFEWLSRQLEAEREGQDFHAAVRRELEARGVKEADVTAQTLRH